MTNLTDEHKIRFYDGLLNNYETLETAALNSLSDLSSILCDIGQEEHSGEVSQGVLCAIRRLSEAMTD